MSAILEAVTLPRLAANHSSDLCSMVILSIKCSYLWELTPTYTLAGTDLTGQIGGSGKGGETAAKTGEGFPPSGDSYRGNDRYSRRPSSVKDQSLHALAQSQGANPSHAWLPLIRFRLRQPCLLFQTQRIVKSILFLRSYILFNLSLFKDVVLVSLGGVFVVFRKRSKLLTDVRNQL